MMLSLCMFSWVAPFFHFNSVHGELLRLNSLLNQSHSEVPKTSSLRSLHVSVSEPGDTVEVFLEESGCRQQGRRRWGEEERARWQGSP